MFQRSRKALQYGKQTICALYKFQQVIKAEVNTASRSRHQFRLEYYQNYKQLYTTSSVKRNLEEEGGGNSFDDFVDQEKLVSLQEEQDEQVSNIQSKLLSWLLQAVVRPDEKIAIKMLLTQFQVPLVIQQCRTQFTDSQLTVLVKVSEIGEVFPGTDLRILSVSGEAEKVFIVMALIINNLYTKQKQHEVKSNLPFFIRVFIPEYLRSYIVGVKRSIQDEICQLTLTKDGG
eukprot:TRINITY_DN7479_c0_g1_i1.p1 TRINITY_DN7479_c0_g1~~TRINITY_DN7479_c0_g1_i1.p1  ORF type:complete len:231 (-),score=21.61 TRINITY_DN7479_c0_g1_i1:64-756(-)